MKVTIDLDRATYWRLHCRATEHGIDIGEEIAGLVAEGTQNRPGQRRSAT